MRGFHWNSAVNIASALMIAAAFCFSLLPKNYHEVHYLPALGLLGLVLLIGLLRKTLLIPTTTATVALLLLWSLCAITFALSTVPFISQTVFCIFCALPLAFFGTGLSHNIVKPLAILAAIIFATLSLWALAQAFFMPGQFYGYRATGPFIDPNIMATISLIGLLPLAGLAIGSTDKTKRIVLTLLTLLIFAGLIATASRSGLIAAVLCLALLLLSYRNRTGLWLAVSALILAFVIPFFSGSTLWASLSQLPAPANASVTDRLSLWHTAWRMMLDSPWIGTGPGTFHLYYPAWREPLADQSLGHFAHLDPLQMGTEMGIAAPILFYTLLIAVLLRTLTALRATTDATLRLNILTPFATLLGVALLAHVNFPLYMMSVLIACGVLLAIWHSATTDVLGSGSVVASTLRTKVALRGLGTILIATILYLTATFTAGNYFLDRAKGQQNRELWLIDLMSAKNLGPESFIEPEIEIARVNLQMLAPSGGITTYSLREKLLRETTRLLDAAAAWNPAWGEVDYLKGQMYQAKGQKGPMFESWFTALKKNPMHYEARKDLAVELVANGRAADAVDVVTRGLNYPHPLSYREWAANFLKGIRKP